MFVRIFLLSILVLSTTAQSRDNGPGEGCACEDYQRDSMRYQERGRGGGRCNTERHRRGEGYRGSRMGGRGCGGHSRWNIPVQEARRLNPIEVSLQSLVRGETLFRDNCTRCHGEYGFGDGPQANDLRVLPPSLHHATRHYTDGELSYIIRKGRDPMPAWEGKLSENQLWDLINYLRFEIGVHYGPSFKRGGRFNHGSRFEYCPDQYRTGEQMKYEYQDHDAMDQNDMHDENHELHHEEEHDEHQDD